MTSVDEPRPEPVEPVEPVEESPLLGSTGAGYGSGNGAGGEEGSEDRPPKPTHKLHLLLPALAIGIFLSALDQTLIVATYARISSDLQALNRTSWISTAWVVCPFGAE